MQIRHATIEDLKTVIYIEQVCFPEAEAATPGSLKQRLEAFDDCFFVGSVDNKIIGFINGCISNHKTIKDELYEDISLHQKDASYQMIFGLDVLPEYQHHGYAKQLMYYMIESAKKRGKKGIALTCKEHLIAFYEQFGYQNNGISSSTHGGVVWYDMFLEL